MQVYIGKQAASWHLAAKLIPCPFDNSNGTSNSQTHATDQHNSYTPPPPHIHARAHTYRQIDTERRAEGERQTPKCLLKHLGTVQSGHQMKRNICAEHKTARLVPFTHLLLT